MRTRSFLPGLLLVAVSAAAACSASTGNDDSAGAGASAPGAGGSGGATMGAKSLSVTPADVTLELVNGQPFPAVDYVASLVFADQSMQVEPDAVFSIDDPSLGSFVGAHFTAAGSTGSSTVHARYSTFEATATLTVKIAQTIVTTGTSADAPTKFGGPPDPNRAPSLVYPADGVIVPPNMNVLEFHFMPGAGNDLFEITFSTATQEVKVYTGCTTLGAGCMYSPDPSVWTILSNLGRGNDPLGYTVRGTNSGGNVGVGSSASQKIAFGQQDIVGGLYYWNAGAGATMRYEFGVSGKSAELFLNAPEAGAGICIGCHALSRDGTRIIEGADIPGLAPYKVFDVSTKKLLVTGAGASNFSAFSPDSKQMLTSDGVTISLRTTDTGAAVTDPLVKSGTMPDWSPDGNTIVYAKPPANEPMLTQPGVDNASLETMKLAAGKWTAGPTLVPFTGQNNYYPSFSPDGTFVLFNRTSGNSYDSMTAKVFAVDVNGGTPIELTQASTGGDSWPKWAPDVQPYRGGQLMWLTFSSRRAYGLRGGGTAQLWMTAFDPARGHMGVDPSYPAFWLPFQDLSSGNHIAQWVTKVQRQDCTSNSECASGEQCQNGVCLPILK